MFNLYDYHNSDCVITLSAKSIVTTCFLGMFRFLTQTKGDNRMIAAIYQPQNLCSAIDGKAA